MDDATIIVQTEMTRRLFLDPAACADLIVPIRGQGTLAEPAFFYSQKQALQLDKGRMVISSVLSDEREPDRSKEVVVLSGMELDGWERNPLGLFMHDHTSPVSLLQDEKKKFTVRKSAKQLLGDYHMIQSGPMAELATQVFELSESGVLNGSSLGFRASYKDVQRVPDDPNDLYGSATTYIKKSKPYESSLVFIPDNDRALVTQVVRKGVGQGSGLRPLHGVLMKSLAPYADPAVVWSNGWTPPASPPAPPPPPPGGEKAVGANGSAGEQVREVVKEVIKEVIPDAIKEKAALADVYERAIGRQLGLPLSDYDGKPSQKALRAMHDTAMFSALSALATLNDTDGQIEKGLLDFARTQMTLARDAVETHEKMFGSKPDWAGVDAVTMFEASRGTPDEQQKEFLAKALDWAVQAGGWRKAHVRHLHAAHSFLDSLAGKKDLTDDDRAKARDLAGRVKGLSDDKGRMVPQADVETEKALADLHQKVDKLLDENKELRSKIQRAKYGAGV